MVLFEVLYHSVELPAALRRAREERSMAEAPGLGWPERCTADAPGRPSQDSGLGWPVSRETDSESAVMTVAMENSAIRVTPETAVSAPVREGTVDPGSARFADGPETVAVASSSRTASEWPRPASCRIITIANQKGGVGKTTTAVNLAAGLARHGARVLVIDFDPQGNASTALNVEHHSGVPSIYNVLVEDLPLASVVRQAEEVTGLYCAPATIDLAGAEIELVPMVARETRLARALADYDRSNFDYIFVDCPPSLGLLTVNALVAAVEVLIPIQCEYYALEGLEQLLRSVDLVKDHLNPDLRLSTILLTMYDARTRLAAQVAEDVRAHFGQIVLGAVIPRSVRVSEAPSYGQSVLGYDPGSSGALAYMEAARELALRNMRPLTAD